MRPRSPLSVLWPAAALVLGGCALSEVGDAPGGAPRSADGLGSHRTPYAGAGAGALGGDTAAPGDQARAHRDDPAGLSIVASRPDAAPEPGLGRATARADAGPLSSESVRPGDEPPQRPRSAAPAAAPASVPDAAPASVADAAPIDPDAGVRGLDAGVSAPDAAPAFVPDAVPVYAPDVASAFVPDAVPAHAPDTALPDTAIPDAQAPDAAPVDAALPDALVEPAVPFTPEDIALVATLRMAPPPDDPTNHVADSPEAARLGQRIFHDVRFSSNGLRSCAYCHWPDRYFSGILTYDAHGGLDYRNVPSLIGASSQPWMFWDGRADTLWNQIRTPMESPHEMALDRVRVIRRVRSELPLRRDYEAAFGPLPDETFWATLPGRAKPSDVPYEAVMDTAWHNLSEDQRVTVNTMFTNVGKALEAYQRLLRPEPAPFDVFVDGLTGGDAQRMSVLSPAAQRGLKLFIGDAGCVNCHSGSILADGAFHNVGLPLIPGAPPDEGRFAGIPQVLADELNAASRYSDAPDGDRARRLAHLVAEPRHEGAFKTATLRNVAETPPYMHDGHFNTLAEVVRFKTELPNDPAVGVRDARLVPIALDDGQVDALVQFLESLTSPPLDPALRQPLP